MVKLILSEDTQTRVQEIMAPLKHPEQWQEMQIPFAPSPSAVVMLIGEPGTGKTALANYMARQLKTPPLRISFQDIASQHMGETEKQIKHLFEIAHEQEAPTIIMEECDAILYSRDMVDSGNVHQLGFVNTMLTEIDRFIARSIPSLLLLATNYPKILDAALLRRITDTVELFSPIGPHAQKMWKTKIPVFLKPTKEDLEKLSLIPHTPDQMEKKILKICRRSLVTGKPPTMDDLSV
jgi:SpoVK/Ycf46/Vps4 family AAA+-type ATPase